MGKNHIAGNGSEQVSASLSIDKPAGWQVTSVGRISDLACFPKILLVEEVSQECVTDFEPASASELCGKSGADVVVKVFFLVAIEAWIIVTADITSVVSPARASTDSPMSRKVSCDFLPTDEAEVYATSADHVVAAASLGDVLLAARALLVVFPFDHVLKGILFVHCLAHMLVQPAHILVPVLLARPARTSRTARANHCSFSFLSQEHLAHLATLLIPVAAIQSLLDRRLVLAHLGAPLVLLVFVQQILERPVLELLPTPARGVGVFVHHGLLEERHDALPGAIVADALGALFGDPAWQRLPLLLVAEDAGEVCWAHGEVSKMLVVVVVVVVVVVACGFSDSGSGSGRKSALGDANICGFRDSSGICVFGKERL